MSSVSADGSKEGVSDVGWLDTLEHPDVQGFCTSEDAFSAEPQALFELMGEGLQHVRHQFLDFYDEVGDHGLVSASGLQGHTLTFSTVFVSYPHPPASLALCLHLPHPV